MSLIDFDAIASGFPVAWKSSVVGNVGPSRIKVLRMDEQAYEEETHDYNEGLLVVSGKLMLEVRGEAITVEPGQMASRKKGAPEKAPAPL